MERIKSLTAEVLDIFTWLQIDMTSLLFGLAILVLQVTEIGGRKMEASSYHSVHNYCFTVETHLHGALSAKALHKTKNVVPGLSHLRPAPGGGGSVKYI